MTKFPNFSKLTKERQEAGVSKSAPFLQSKKFSNLVNLEIWLCLLSRDTPRMALTPRSGLADYPTRRYRMAASAGVLRL
jgi:hypothetical protein